MVSSSWLALPEIAIVPPSAVEIRPTIPGSKSMTNRALLLAALAEGPSRLRGWLDAEDSRLMWGALRAIDLAIDEDGDALVVAGQGAPWRFAGERAIEVGTAGTVARFLLAALANAQGRARVDGSARMRERPMDVLIAALREQGAAIEDLGVPGALPVRVGPAAQPLAGGEIRLPRPASSQFVSGLVFAALHARAPTRIVLEQGTPARPYVEMTLAQARVFGADVDWRGPDTIAITPTRLRGRELVIEPDASAASYFLALAAIHGGTAEIADLGTDSLQGDARFVHVLARMGAEIDQRADRTRLRGRSLVGGDFDLSDMPDMTLTLAVVALHATGPTRIRGVGILRHHESDRLEAAATELRKLGAEVEVEHDGLRITPPAAGPRSGVRIATYGDHRMAMAFSLAGRVEIADPGCVAKTFPRYFNALADLGMVGPSSPGLR